MVVHQKTYPFMWQGFRNFLRDGWLTVGREGELIDLPVVYLDNIPEPHMGDNVLVPFHEQRSVIIMSSSLRVASYQNCRFI